MSPTQTRTTQQKVTDSKRGEKLFSHPDVDVPSSTDIEKENLFQIKTVGHKFTKCLSSTLKVNLQENLWNWNQL